MDYSSRSLKKAFIKMSRWIWSKSKTNQDHSSDTEWEIDDDYSSLATGDCSKNVKSISGTRTIKEMTDDEEKKTDQDTGNLDLETVMTVVNILYIKNIRMEKELNLLKKGQCSFEQRIQTIQDSHAAIMSNKDAKCDFVVEKLKTLTEEVTKTTRDVVNLSKLENDSKKKLDNELNHIQEINRSVSLKIIDIDGTVLQLMKNQNANNSKLEKQLEICKELAIKNSTDIVNCDAKIEKLLEKTVAVVVIQKNALIDAKTIVAKEIYNIKSKLAMIERRCNMKQNHISTDIQNIRYDMKKDLRDIGKSQGLKNEKADQNNRKHDKLKMRLSVIENDMRNQSERFTQNMLMMSMGCLRGVNQPNSVHETVFQPGSISPRAPPTTSSPSYSTPIPAPPSCSTPPSAPPPPPFAPPPPPPSPPGPQVKQYPNYVVTDELLKDMHKRLRKTDEGISKISECTDINIPCCPEAILPEEHSESLPSPSSQLSSSASPLPPPAPPLPLPAPLLPQEPQVETTSV